MFKTINIDHVGVNTNDMEATVQFYCGILGMKIARTMRTPNGGRHYNVEIGGGNAFAFFETDKELSKTGNQYLNHFAIPVATSDEFDEALKRLTDNGVETTEIIERDWGKTFYFSDPNGIRLQIELQFKEDLRDVNGDPDPVPSAAKFMK
jgi:catechol 2,3-dioxygenase-like lactoylglutathione lyase family enzyme